MIAANLRILLVVFALSWLLVVIFLVRKNKIPIKYSLIWFLTSFVILSVGLVPKLFSQFTRLIGFETSSNFVIGIILFLLLLITIILTVIVSKQNQQIKSLIQEIALLEEDVKK